MARELKILQEALLLESRQMTLWHGGNIKDRIGDSISHKKGRWEYGPGLYLTTHYQTAKKYATGSKKFYQITISQGTDINDVDLDYNEVITFVKTHLIKNKQQRILDTLERRQSSGKVPANILLNLIINDDAMQNSKTNILMDFFVDNGIDYALVPNAFGWHEMMVVLFNSKKIVSKKIISPKDKIEEYDLPTSFK
jgi:hypothetical protein